MRPLVKNSVFKVKKSPKKESPRKNRFEAFHNKLITSFLQVEITKKVGLGRPLFT